MEGRRLKLPVQMGRRPIEPPEPDMEPFYRRLLAALRHPVFHQGRWQFLPAREAWAGNGSYASLMAHCWTLDEQARLIVANLGPGQSQGFVPLLWPDLAGQTWQLTDILSGVQYTRDGDDLLARGLYLDMPGHGYHLFRLHVQEHNA